MKALVLSDIHSRLENLEKIIKLIHNEGVGLVVIAGDLTNYGEKAQAEKVLEKLSGFKVLAVPGNLDTEQVVEFLEEKKVSLHGKKAEVDGIEFIGFGAGLQGSPGSLLKKEEEIKEALEKLFHSQKKKVLVTHLPPFGTRLDLAETGARVGSKSVKEIILEKKPVLHFCGHCHECFGEENLGETTSINVAAVKDGRALVIDLEAMKWKRIQL